MFFSLIYFVLSAGGLRQISANEDFLLVATTDHLRYCNLSDLVDGCRLVAAVNISNSVAVDYDPVERVVYWSDVRRNIISRIGIDGNDQRVILYNVTTVDGLTVDVPNRKLYWTDTGNDTIERSNLDGTDRELLIDTDLDEPRAIVLDTDDSRMYWTDWGARPKIERALTTGTKRETLISTGLIYPNGLVLDRDRRLMYWADAITDQIEVASLDGTNRRILLKESEIHPFAIVLYGDHLYWSDWSRMAVLRYRVAQTETAIEVMLSLLGRPTCVKAVSLKSGQNLLLIGGDNQIREISLDEDSDLGKPILSLSEVRLPLSIEYDANLDRIFWSELKTTTIRVAYRNGSEERPLVESNINYVTGLSFSSETNELFWVDRWTSVVEKLDLDTLRRTTLVRTNNTSPTDLALDPIHRYVYWVDSDRNTIERVKYDGSERSLVLAGLDKPVALTLDARDDLIYWNDFGTGTFNLATLDGKNARPFASGARISDFSLLGRFLYWVEMEKNVTGRINRYSYSDVAILQSMSERFMGLSIINIGRLVFSDVTPSAGPTAGGTNITISGDNFLLPLSVQSYEECRIHFANSTTIIAETAAVSDDLAGKTYPVLVQFIKNKIVSTGYNFTYKPNPVITSVHPRATIRQGGTTLTVDGKSFDSVFRPMLKLDQVLETIEITSNRVLSKRVTTYYGECSRTSTTQLACIVPELASTNDKRVRRVPTVEVETIYIGLVLDGVDKYRNLSANSKTSSFGVLTISDPPNFSKSGPDEPFIFKRGQQLDIKGEDIDKISSNDYSVDVGLEQCKIISLTATTLFCMPPQEEPSKTANGSYPQTHTYDVVVHVGRNLQLNVGQLYYPSASNIYLGVGCAAVVLLVALIVITVVVVRRRSRRNPDVNDDYENNHGGLSFISLPNVKSDF